MKMRRFIFPAAACIVLALFVLKKNKQTETPSTEESTSIESTETQGTTAPQSFTQKKSAERTQEKNTAVSKKIVPGAKKDETPLYQQGPLTTQEVESVNNLTKTISRAIAKKNNSTQFMKAIQALHLQPKFIDEGSNALGSMVTVRTNDALEGTRYLHAQFTGEKNNADYLQHVSFQIRSGSDSFQKAVEILNQVLPKNKILKESDSDYILYNTADGYVAWAKIATREDLKSNKYNASSKEDIGTVIVTIEQEIHDMDDDHSH